MARSVDEVQDIRLPILGGIMQGCRAGLDGDAPLPLQLHGVQKLLRPDALVNGVALLQKPVCQGGLAMVNVGHDGKISNMGKVGHIGVTSESKEFLLPLYRNTSKK